MNKAIILELKFRDDFDTQERIDLIQEFSKRYKSEPLLVRDEVCNLTNEIAVLNDQIYFSDIESNDMIDELQFLKDFSLSCLSKKLSVELNLMIILEKNEIENYSDVKEMIEKYNYQTSMFKDGDFTLLLLKQSNERWLIALISEDPECFFSMYKEFSKTRLGIEIK